VAKKLYVKITEVIRVKIEEVRKEEYKLNPLTDD
jgi:hypothetical protein